MHRAAGGLTGRRRWRRLRMRLGMGPGLAPPPPGDMASERNWSTTQGGTDPRRPQGALSRGVLGSQNTAGREKESNPNLISRRCTHMCTRICDLTQVRLQSW